MIRELNFAERRGLWNWIRESVGNPTIRRQFILPSKVRSFAEAEQLIYRAALATPALRSTLFWMPAGAPAISVGPLPTIRICSDPGPAAGAVDPLHRSAVFQLKKAGPTSDVEVDLTICHLFADAGGADALVRQLESGELPEDSADEPFLTYGSIDDGRPARNREFWLELLTGGRLPAIPYCGVDRTCGYAATVSLPLPSSVAAQVNDLAGSARVTASTVWAAAVALAAQERCAGEAEVVCRLTCANRYAYADMSAVDYRAQPVFLPLSFQLDQPASEALSQVHRLSLLVHSHGWYDALHVIEQLNRPSRGAWFLPTVELNVLQGTRGSQSLGSAIKPFSFNPSSAKADMVVGIDDCTVSMTIRGAETFELAAELLERVMEWPSLLARGYGRPLAESVQQGNLPNDFLLHMSEAAVSRKSMQDLIRAALGDSRGYDIGLDQSGRVVVRAPRPLRTGDALQLWRQQSLVPRSIVPHRWIADEAICEPRTLAEAGQDRGWVFG